MLIRLHLKLNLENRLFMMIKLKKDVTQTEITIVT